MQCASHCSLGKIWPVAYLPGILDGEFCKVSSPSPASCNGTVSDIS